MKWLRLYSSVLHDPKVQLLPADVFKQQFMAAAAGEESVFSGVVYSEDERLPAREWHALREHVFARDEFTCRYCGTRTGPFACDHVIPISRGGSNDADNLVTACIPCNSSKHAKTPQEWRR